MKLNPKIARSPEDLKSLEFNKIKGLIKKDLLRLEKYTSQDNPTQCILLGDFAYINKSGIPLPLFGKWLQPFKDYAKKHVAVKEPMGAIGIAYFGGETKEGKKIIYIKLAKGKGKTKISVIERNIKKIITPALYKVVFGSITEETLNALEKKIDSAPEVEEIEESNEDIFLQDELEDHIPPMIGEVYSLERPLEMTVNGKDLVLEVGIEVVITRIEDKIIHFNTFVDGNVVAFDIPREDFFDALSHSLEEVVVMPNNAITRLEELKKEDYDSMFVDVDDEKASYILRTFNGNEQQAFWEEESLQKFVVSEFSEEEIINSITKWNAPLVDKLIFFRENKISYSYTTIRELVLRSDKTGLDFLTHFSLFRLSIKDLRQFAEDLKLAPREIALLEAKFKIKINSLELNASLYDDLADKSREVKFNKDDLKALVQAEEKKKENLSEEEKTRIIKWFKKNALIEVFAQLDLSENQVNSVLYNFAGEQYGDLTKDFLEILSKPYADGIYTYREALSKRKAVRSVYDEGVNKVMQREVKKGILDVLGRKYPILYAIEDYLELEKTIQKKDPKVLQNYLEDICIEVLQNINKTRKKFRSDDNLIWKMEKAYENTFHNLSLHPQTQAGLIIAEAKEAYESGKAIESFIGAALSVGLGLLAAVSTGGLSLILTASAVAVGAHDLKKEWDNYEIMEAASHTSLEPSLALTEDDPSLMWVALSCVGVLGDVLSVAKILKTIKIGQIATLSDVDRYSDDLAKVLAKEKGITDFASEDFKQIKRMVTEQALAAMQKKVIEADAAKALLYKKAQDANWELYLELRGKLRTGLDPNVVAKLMKSLMYQCKLGVATLEDALKALGTKIDDLLKKAGITIEDAETKKILDDIFKEAKHTVDNEIKVIKKSFDDVDSLRAINETDIYNKSTEIEKAWEDFLKNTPPPVVDITIKGELKKVQLSFNEQGEMLVDGKKLSKEQRNSVYEQLGVAHATDNHASGEDLRHLAQRTTLNGENAQSGKFLDDQVMVMAVEYARKKCFANGAFDVNTLLANGTITKSGQKFYIFQAPVPRSYGTVYFNTNIEKLPAWVKVVNPSPFKEFPSVVEIPVTQVRVVFDNTGKIISTYSIAFK